MDDAHAGDAAMWRFEGETIRIDNLQVRCIVGVRPDEREREQPLVLSIAFPAEFAAAAESETLERTVDYSEVARAARAFVQEGRFRLLETLARRLGVHLCERFGLARVNLHVRKPQAIPDSDGPAVSLTVTREAP
jgi:FolB domain-containing protein